jgi:regulatory protein
MDGYKKKKAPPKPSQRYVNWALMSYLKRYSAPRAHVKRVLWRKLEGCIAFHDGDRDEVSAWIEGALDQAVQGGMIDDERYVKDKVKSLLRRGGSSMGIAYKLRAKGIPREMVDRALAEVADAGFDHQWISAATYVRRVRMGPFRVSEMDPKERYQKDLGRMGRAGFSFDIAQKILAMEVEEIEDIAFKRRFI